VGIYESLRQELLNASMLELGCLALVCIGGFYVLGRLVVEQSSQPVAPLPRKPAYVKPVPRPYTLEQLAEHKGMSGDKSIWIAVQGNIFDVSAKSGFYGPGGGYHIFAGRDATRALALTSLDVKDVDNASISDLTDLSTLNEWVASYKSKYDIIGWLASAADVKTWEDEQRAKATAHAAEKKSSDAKHD